MTEELKPCPFCGGDPTEHAIEPHTHAMTLGDFKMPDHEGSHVIECACGAGFVDDTREAAATRWNTRALTAAQPAQAGRDAFESVLIDGVAYDVQAPVAAELLRLHIELQALPTQPAAQADSMGMPTSCGKPLCSPDEHHPLCKLHKPAAQATPEPVPNDDAWKAEALGKMDQIEALLENLTAAHEAAATPEPVGEQITSEMLAAGRKAIHETLGASSAGIARCVYESMRAAQATPEPVGKPTEGEFFAWDAEGGIAFYKARQEAINHAKESLRYYQDKANNHGEWDEDVEHIRWGVVMQRAEATNISATEDGESSCDYELQDVATHPAPGVPDGEPKLTQEELLEVAKHAWLMARTADSLQFYRTLLSAAAQAKGGEHG